jgi:hypothetical protein
MAGALSDEVDMKTPEFAAYRQRIGPEKWDAFVAKYPWMDQGKYLSQAAPAFVFMQFATQEDFLKPPHVLQYERIVSKPNMLKIYEAPHSLNAEARRDRIQFLAEQLKLKKVPPEVISRIPDLYQPPQP